MPADESQPGSPEHWLRYARSDLELARVSPPPEVMLEQLCFHAQQAAEKAFKAVLISLNIPFPKTHSIRTLLDLLSTSLSVPEEIEEVAILTDYAVMARYPGDSEPVEPDEHREAIRLAEFALSWAEKIIEADN